MPAATHLVLGTAFGYSPQQLRPFVETLRQHYDGEVQLLISSQNATELVPYLLEWKITPRLFDVASWMFVHVQLGRFVRYFELLRESPVGYDRIFLTDVPDVFFQANPFAGAPEGDLVFFLEDSRMSIGRCPNNSQWVRQIFGEQILAQLADRPIACSGTTMGSHEAIVHYLRGLISHASPEKMFALSRWRGHDQGIHNFLLHSGTLPGIRTVQNGAWIHTLGQLSEAEVRIGEDGIRTAAGERCPIVHQWTYLPAAAAWVADRWGR